MQITVSGKQVDAIRGVRTRVAGHWIVSPENIRSCAGGEGHLQPGPEFLHCDINVHAGRGLNWRGEGDGGGCEQRLDDARQHIGRSGCGAPAGEAAHLNAIRRTRTIGDDGERTPRRGVMVAPC